MKKILLVNLVIVLILFGIMEFISYLYIKEDSKSYMDEYNKSAKQNGLPLLTQRYAPVQVFNQAEFKDRYRQGYKGNPKKGSVLFFGCSYTYGSLVEENKTLPYLTGKKSGITTINRGIGGGSILNTLYDLTHNDLYESLDKLPVANRSPKYIIYTYINDHGNRIFNPYKGSVTSSDNAVYTVNKKYEIKDGKLKEKSPSFLKRFLYHFYTTKAYYFFYSQNFARESMDDKMFNLLNAAKRITDEKFPKSKFVILLYKDGSHINMSEYLQNRLKEEGFIILDSEKLAKHELESEKYRAGDKEHPNEQAYNDVASGLTKALKL